MFTIIISEKGGAERRENFDKTEINVGRVQGNDLMLPKGNVSKHHARLLFRDGRFIVTDLKSTNGTYVNGRKIAQATIVREGDKIYIGDFVLRLDTGQGVAAGDGDSSYDDASGRTPARMVPGSPAGAPSVTAAPVAAAIQPSVAAAAPAPAVGPSFNPALGMGGAGAGRSDTQGVSHIPLERDPDESGSGPGAPGGGIPKVPAPPRVPTGAGVAPASSSGTGAGGPGTDPRMRNSLAAAQPARVPGAPLGAPTAAPAIARPPTALPVRQPPRETQAQAARRLALLTLVDRITDNVDSAALKNSPTVSEELTQKIERVAREQVKAMRDDNEIADSVDAEQLARDAVRELVGVGPIGPLLEEDDVHEIHCLRHDSVVITRGGGQLSLADAPFTSDEALSRAVLRLASQAGAPVASGEAVVERKLARGAELVALMPPAAANTVAVIRKRRRVESTMEDLVRQGALSRPMATFLDHCMAARANLLLCGSSTDVVASLTSALASLGQPADRVVVLQEAEDVAISQGQTVTIPLSDDPARAERAVRGAARLRPERVIASPISARIGSVLLEVIADGADGVWVGTSAPSLRQGLLRFATQLVLSRPGISAESARDLVIDTFDVAIEVGRAPDGRLRVTRIAEMAGSEPKNAAPRDLFSLSVDGASGGEAAFVASGTVPRLVHDFQGRGVRVDPSLFKRSVGR